VPIYAERGPGGGCALIEGYRTTLTGLTDDEARTLFLSGTTQALADLGLGPALDAALLKLLAALPAVHRERAARMQQRLYLDAAAWNHTEEDIPHLRTIQDAIWQDRKLRLTYHSRNGVTTDRVVDPLGLVAKTSVWYLVTATNGAMRVFRVSRVRDTVMLDEPCTRPANFDLVAYWQEWRAQFRASLRNYPVTLRLSPAALPLLPHIFGEGERARVVSAGAPDADGCLTLPFVFESFETARADVLRFGTFAEVIEPPELRAGVAALAQNIAAMYAPCPV
jgi:predicted DNA-binding transcriptional regulator YafY